MTRDNYQQFWCTGVVKLTKLDHYFTVSVNPKTFLGFEITPNLHDIAPLIVTFNKTGLLFSGFRSVMEI